MPSSKPTQLWKMDHLSFVDDVPNQRKLSCKTSDLQTAFTASTASLYANPTIMSTTSSQTPSSSSWEVSSEACEEKRVKTLSGVNPWFFSSMGCRQKVHEWHLAHYLLIHLCTSQLQHFIAFAFQKLSCRLMIS